MYAYEKSKYTKNKIDETNNCEELKHIESIPNPCSQLDWYKVPKQISDCIYLSKNYLLNQ